ncbi:hypothetical protein PFISCL1PPCAC_18169, partial [Pristionchus fissidentatus]
SKRMREEEEREKQIKERVEKELEIRIMDKLINEKMQEDSEERSKKEEADMYANLIARGVNEEEARLKSKFGRKKPIDHSPPNINIRRRIALKQRESVKARILQEQAAKAEKKKQEAEKRSADYKKYDEMMEKKGEISGPWSRRRRVPTKKRKTRSPANQVQLKETEKEVKPEAAASTPELKDTEKEVKVEAATPVNEKETKSDEKVQQQSPK